MGAEKFSIFQIQLTPYGPWHRKAYDNGHSACGLSTEGGFLSRDWRIDENLCVECFSSFELEQGRARCVESTGPIEPYEGYDDDDPTDIVTSEFNRVDSRFDDSDKN
jgi:hypothetical protein